MYILFFVFDIYIYLSACGQRPRALEKRGLFLCLVWVVPAWSETGRNFRWFLARSVVLSGFMCKHLLFLEVVQMINAKIRALSTIAIHLPMCTMSVHRDKNWMINAKIGLSTIVIHLAMFLSATSITALRTPARKTCQLITDGPCSTNFDHGDMCLYFYIHRYTFTTL